MASLIPESNGRYKIQFTLGAKRPTLRLGKVSKANAEEAKRHVEHILAAKEMGDPVPPVTARWIAQLSSKLRDRVAKCGLVQNGSAPTTLEEVMQYCLAIYKQKNKPSTHRNMKRSADALMDHFGKKKLISSITVGDTNDFRHWLEFTEELAPTTVSEMCKKSKTLFEMARDKKWIDDNPFRKMKGWVTTNDERKEFIERRTIDRILKHCEPEWQLIISLVRYGGLRCPSELEGLRWQYVNFEDRRLTVWAPKTERYVRKKFRVLPLFAELEPHLQAAYDRAPAGAEFVVTAHRGSKTALRSAFLKRLARAGVAPWEKLFHNMRSSRQTELENEFPNHVVCAWLGNSQRVAQDHYLQVTDEHFDRALKKSGVKSGVKNEDQKRSSKDQKSLKP